MPVTIEYRINEAGWKKSANGRFGPVAVARFMATDENGVFTQRFEWAPTLDDLDRMKTFCDMVNTLDRYNKALLQLTHDMNLLNNGSKENPGVGKTILETSCGTQISCGKKEEALEGKSLSVKHV